MDVTIALEARYFVTPDGAGWSSGGMDYKFWERYLEVFDRVRIVARSIPTKRAMPAWLPVTGDGVNLSPIPNYQGPLEYLKQFCAIQKAMWAAIPQRGALILRAPSEVGNCLEQCLRLRDRDYPFAVEVVGDPYEVFAAGVVDHPLRPLFRWHFSRRLRRQCRDAIGAAYVTKRALQMRYPARSMVGISDVEIDEESFAADCSSSRRTGIVLDPEFTADARKARAQETYKLVAVGSLAQLYKGVDVLIEAVARCVHSGVDLTAVIVGDGARRRDLENIAERLKIRDRCHFRGELPGGKAVRDVLDAADLFVLPSRTEGLPRALVEAMARALPCIGSNVGGIPELLDSAELVPPNDPAALAAKILEVLRDANRMEAMSLRNLEVARGYCKAVLGKQRVAFYQQIRSITQSWESNRMGTQCVPSTL